MRPPTGATLTLSLSVVVIVLIRQWGMMTLTIVWNHSKSAHSFILFSSVHLDLSSSLTVCHCFPHAVISYWQMLSPLIFKSLVLKRNFVLLDPLCLGGCMCDVCVQLCVHTWCVWMCWCVQDYRSVCMKVFCLYECVLCTCLQVCECVSMGVCVYEYVCVVEYVRPALITSLIKLDSISLREPNAH